MRISAKTPAECPWCHRTHILADWESSTKAICVNRAMRRDYHTILDSDVWGVSVERYYLCPTCKTMYKANQLKLVTDDPRLKGLGGQPLEARVITREVPDKDYTAEDNAASDDMGN